MFTHILFNKGTDNLGYKHYHPVINDAQNCLKQSKPIQNTTMNQLSL